jgi:hypothetical protein
MVARLQGRKIRDDLPATAAAAACITLTAATTTSYDEILNIATRCYGQCPAIRENMRGPVCAAQRVVGHGAACRGGSTGLLRGQAAERKGEGYDGAAHHLEYLIIVVTVPVWPVVHANRHQALEVPLSSS